MRDCERQLLSASMEAEVELSHFKCQKMTLPSGWPVTRRLGPRQVKAEIERLVEITGMQ